MEIWRLDALGAEAHRPRVLRSDEGAARVVALVLPRGELLGDHQVHEHAWLVLLEGELIVRSGEEERPLEAGSLVHFEPTERHEVEAARDAQMLLLLAPWPGPGHPRLRPA